MKANTHWLVLLWFVFEISTVDVTNVSHDFPFFTGMTIYAVLSKKEKFWTIDYVSSSKPHVMSHQVFMRGRIKQVSGNSVAVEWGIESFFIPERKSAEIAERMRNAKSVSVIVLVNSKGFSTLKVMLIDGEPVTFE